MPAMIPAFDKDLPKLTELLLPAPHRLCKFDAAAGAHICVNESVDDEWEMHSLARSCSIWASMALRRATSGCAATRASRSGRLPLNCLC
eukprot:CAMPEP_0115524036 /NCGR_PEP_ID=MMETSP0271-20121206/80964_1 /TAXON_ID=71861 /ORGANISM="Scrippsiella trochoidea, Strain CCMP3099" /LENGTH=88 /DNA_ID=CAMNT_0002955505 /DNA_START=363 /DNA_END=627 /DNA_ORIENTATION=+